MSTHITSTNPVRNDLSTGAGDAEARRPGRLWAVAGIGAGLAGAVTVVTSSMVDAVYDPSLNAEPAAIAEKLATQTGPMFVFHVATVVGALLTVVFAAGLHLRLRAVLGDSVAALVAFAGLLGTAVVSILGSGLDTEFTLALAAQDGVVHETAATMYNHWIGTIPWLWTLSGLAGVALFAAARRGGVPRWIGWVGLVLGGLTVLFGVSPFQYMSAATGVLWLLATAVGFTAGDRGFRSAA